METSNLNIRLSIRGAERGIVYLDKLWLLVDNWSWILYTGNIVDNWIILTSGTLQDHGGALPADMADRAIIGSRWRPDPNHQYYEPPAKALERAFDSEEDIRLAVDCLLEAYEQVMLMLTLAGEA